MAFTTILNEHFITLSVNLTVNMTVICLLVCCFFHSSAVDGLKKKKKKNIYHGGWEEEKHHCTSNHFYLSSSWLMRCHKLNSSLSDNHDELLHCQDHIRDLTLIRASKSCNQRVAWKHHILKYLDHILYITKTKWFVLCTSCGSGFSTVYDLVTSPKNPEEDKALEDEWVTVQVLIC